MFGIILLGSAVLTQTKLSVEGTVAMRVCFLCPQCCQVFLDRSSREMRVGCIPRIPAISMLVQYTHAQSIERRGYPACNCVQIMRRERYNGDVLAGVASNLEKV